MINIPDQDLGNNEPSESMLNDISIYHESDRLNTHTNSKVMMTNNGGQDQQN